MARTKDLRMLKIATAAAASVQTTKERIYVAADVKTTSFEKNGRLLRGQFKRKIRDSPSLRRFGELAIIVVNSPFP